MLLWGFLELGTDGLVVVSVGTGGTLTQNLGLGDLSDEHHVAAQIGFFPDFAGEHGIGMLRQVDKAVVASFETYEIGELVNFPAGLHAEVADGLEGHILGQHTDVELTGGLDDFLGQILLLAGDGQSQRIGCHLDAGVDDASVIFPVGSGQHEQAVA